MSHKAKVAYEKLAEGMPDYQIVNNHFDIEDLDEEKMSIKAICKKAKEQLEHYTHLLENILQPDATFCSLTEANAFSDADKKNVLETFRKLMQADRRLVAAQIDGHYDTNLLQMIVQTFEEAKEPLLSIIKQLEECWNHKEEQQIQERYFG